MGSRGERALGGRTAAPFALTCLLTVVVGCSSNAGRSGESASSPHGTTPTTSAPANDRRGKAGFTLANFTGATLRAVYLSPSNSAGWEENVLGGDALADGNSVEIRLNPEKGIEAWDLRVEGVDEHYAEWKGLRLEEGARITLLLDVAGERVVVAEVD
jgi:hypothetical protein